MSERGNNSGKNLVKAGFGVKHLVALVVVAAVFVLWRMPNSGGSAAPAGASVASSAADSVVRIPLSEVSTQMKVYSYEAGGTKINYVIVEGSDGKPRTAFDACEVCGGRKGYRQRGTDVVCRNCGRAFRIDDLGSKNRGGGCWPSYLQHAIQDGNVVIKKSDIEGGRKYF